MVKQQTKEVTMKKLTLFLPIITFAFISIQTDVSAQENSISVGNPESANMIMMEEDYIVSTTQNQTTNNQANQQQNQENSQNNNASVVEDITETETPDSVSIEDDTTVIPNN